MAEAESKQFNYFNYFTELEETFVRRRGKHLWLSTVDWALMESWKNRGIPLHIAINGIERAFDSYEAKPRHRSVKTLLYCQEEVEAQFGEWLEGQVGSATVDGSTNETAAENVEPRLPFPLDTICEHLHRSQLALVEQFKALDGAVDIQLAECFSRASARLKELEEDMASSAGLGVQRLEDALTHIEKMLDDAIDLHATAEILEAVTEYAEQQLGEYRKRMDKETYAQTMATVFRKRLREQYRVPRLSLFYL